MLSGQAEYVSLPAFEGSMGVLAGHTPLVAQLVPGVIHMKRGTDENTFAISGGFVEVRPDRVAIFAETAELAEEINVEQARQEAEKAKVELRGARQLSELDVIKIEGELLAALARLKAAQTLRRRTRPQHPPT